MDKDVKIILSITAVTAMVMLMAYFHHTNKAESLVATKDSPKGDGPVNAQSKSDPVTIVKKKV